jgi:hypothetical protein
MEIKYFIKRTHANRERLRVKNGTMKVLEENSVAYPVA